MEYVSHDEQAVTVRFERDEFGDLIQVLGSVQQEYDGLDVEILNLSFEEVKALKQKLLAVADNFWGGDSLVDG